MNVRALVDRAFATGMHQHRGEIEPFAEWLAPRWPHHVIEIGTLHGGTSVLFDGLATGLMISVDMPGGRFGGADHNLDLARCQDRNRRLGELCHDFVGILGDSHNGTTELRVKRALKGQLACVLFIDADHTYAGVREDYERYRRYVRRGGVVVFHDINDTPLHRDAGCRVDQLWAELSGEKREFNIRSSWGGIGVVRA